MKKPMFFLFGCQTKAIFICFVIFSLALFSQGAFFIAPVVAQEGETAPVTESAPAPAETPPPVQEPVAPAPAAEGAPTNPAPSAPTETGAAEPVALPEGEVAPPPEVLVDIQVTTADLGAKEATIKPDSFWHPFKQLGRNIQEALVFDPINDAELKLQHANQELAEIKQLVEEKGVENVDPKVLTNSVNWFENKLEKIKDASLDIKDKKSDKPAEVETLLNNFTDKQFYEHKVLEKFNEEIMENKDKVETAEDLFVALKDKQDEVLGHFGEVLTKVDEPEKISERLSQVADGQKGSEFKLIKATEILQKLEEQVPEQTKEAIEQAQEKTMKLLEQDMAELAPVVRAEKFEQYTNALPGDETVQLAVFEKLKQMPDIPQDMLEKIEQVKEFAIQKFEKKVEKFEKKEVKDKFFENLNGDDLNDIMVLEELKAKITTRQEELRKKIEAKHTEGLEIFKRQFTDLKSQEQAKRFEKLVKEITNNPNPKTLQLIQGLETEMAKDPEKAAFIENIKNKTKAEFENKFRQEGERFFDRVNTLNPADMAVFQEFKEQEFFDPKMMDEFLSYQTERFKQYVQNIDKPESFDRFQERFRYAPQEVIETIKTQDEKFGELMQFKSRKMEEVELEKKEREVTGKMNDAWEQMENEFQNRLRQATSDEARKTLFEEKRKKDLNLVEKEYTERYALMKERMISDPFCDEKCREIQIYYFDQEFANKKNNIIQEGLKRDLEITIKKPELLGNPFEGKCDRSEDCLAFCQKNPDFQACKMFASSFLTLKQTVPAAQDRVESGMRPTMSPPPCPTGMINIQRSADRWECVNDPYYKTPAYLQKCPYGRVWNEQKGFCEFKTDMFQSMPAAQTMPVQGCPTGEYWDAGRGVCIRQGEVANVPMPAIVNYCGQGEYWDNTRGCVRQDIKQCGIHEYFDFFEQRCLGGTVCPEGEYWDPMKDTCIKDVFVPPTEQCKPGYFWDYYKKQCVEDKYQPPTPKEPIACPTVLPRSCNPGEVPTYGPCGPSCTISSTCPQGQWWDSAKNACVPGAPSPYPTPEPIYCTDEWQPVCGTDNITYSNECYAKKAGVGIRFRGECTPIPTPVPITGYCGDGVCKNGETITSCPGDCGGGIKPCTNYATLGQGCNPSTGTCCSEGTCSNMNGPGSCISSGGTMGCNYNGTCDNGETAGTCPKDCGSTTGCPSTIYNNYTTGFACNYTKCPNRCTFDSKGCPNGCSSSTTSSCGDGICNQNETMTSCPSDCGGTTTCPSTIYNNYTTNYACNYTKCPNGCMFDSSGCPTGCSSGAGCNTYYSQTTCTSYGCIWCSDTNSCYNQGHICGGIGNYCGNKVCDSGETATSCPGDCGSTTTGYCGDKVCKNGETATSCPSDCGTTSGNTCSSMGGTCCKVCAGGSYISGTECNCCKTCLSENCPSNAYTTNAGACNYTMCPNGCNLNSQGCPDGCMSYKGYCGDNVCDSNETTTSCPSDCRSTTTGYCGDGLCQSYETSSSCSTDCGGTPPSPTTGYCGNGTCEMNETSSSCPSDCGSTPPPNTTGYCGDSICQSSETSSSCPSDCGGYTPPPSSVCGNGTCEGNESSSSCPSDCGAPPAEPPPPPPPPTEPPPGEVLGVMSVREIDEISNKVTLTVFEKSAQILSAIFNHDKPAKVPTILVYLPRPTLKASPALKERILWTEGNNYYRLISYTPREVLGAKTQQQKVIFPLITVWEILSAPFK